MLKQLPVSHETFAADKAYATARLRKGSVWKWGFWDSKRRRRELLICSPPISTLNRHSSPLSGLPTL